MDEAYVQGGADRGSVGQGVAKWADPAMFEAAPMPDSGIVNAAQVHLLWMTPDPLGAIAAMCRMYEGIPTYELGAIPDSERHRYWNDALSTHLKAPLEAVKFHFFLEAVDRSFTHQMVRQRTAVFAQESLRFAVKANLATEAIRPPTVVNGGENIQNIWEATLDMIEVSYQRLVDLGIPAEDARGLLPHCVATRLNYVTDLRALADHAGNRLCTQAQFHWRYAFAGIVRSIRTYAETVGSFARLGDHWQFEAIASSLLFRPVCYQLGKCPFKATFDRACSIRERVDAFASRGVPSSQWGDEYQEPNKPGDLLPWAKVLSDKEGGRTVSIIPPIKEAEWLLNPESARGRK